MGLAPAYELLIRTDIIPIIVLEKTCEISATNRIPPHYNMGSNIVRKFARDWFRYKIRKVQERSNKKKDPITATDWFPVPGLIANILLVMGTVWAVFVGELFNGKIRFHPIIGSRSGILAAVYVF
jgi:hypothetical protein